MLEVRVANYTLDKSLKSKVIFPNLSEIAGVSPQVDMIVTGSDEGMFDIPQVLVAISGYTDGMHGAYQRCIREAIAHAGRWSFGEVILFRRGSYFANITALKQLVKHILETSPNAPKIRAVQHTAVYQSLMDCEADRYSALRAVPITSRVLTTDMLQVVPSSLVADRNGLGGTPIKLPSTVKEEEVPEVISSSDPAPESEPATEASATPDSVSVAVDSIPGVLSTLLNSLLKGKKITLTLSIE
jgi:hypothetical protein